MSKLTELRARFAAHQAALSRHSEWVPHRPWAKQLAFLALPELEALYGGAAGGGKTDALLAAALEHVDTPGYSALLLRRTFPDLALPGAIMDRASAWLGDTRATWNERDKQWSFPKGAKLQFGYCDSESDLQRYKSAEFQFIGVDELTEWPERWYTFLFSRLRRLKGSTIPLRMRGATNPDGPGYGWVRERFGIPENTEMREPIRHASRVFFPARAEDNPALDLPAYELALEQMAGGRDGVKWRQLRRGLWIPDGAGLVYVWNAAKNTAPPIGWKAERARWHFVLGIDYGFTNACGFVVAGWRDHDPNVYILEAFTIEQLEPSAAAEVVRGLEVEYDFDRIVGDVGGLGKGYAEEGRSRWNLPIEPAKKENKRGYITLFGDALAAERIKVDVARCADLLDEWRKLPWDPERKAEAKGFANHASDAALYAWRECPSYAEREAEQRPKPGTDEELAALERRYEETVDEELEADEEQDRRARGRFWR